MSAWTRDLESAALHYLTGGSIDPAGARQIIDGLIAKGRAVGHVAGLREAAEMVDVDDDCECGGCDSCTARQDAVRIRAHADRMADALTGITGGEPR